MFLALQFDRNFKLLLPFLSFIWCLTGNMSSVDSPWRPCQPVSLASTRRQCWGGQWSIFEWLVLFICFLPSFWIYSFKTLFSNMVLQWGADLQWKIIQDRENCFSAFPWDRRKQSKHLWLRTYMWDLACRNVSANTNTNVDRGSLLTWI